MDLVSRLRLHAEQRPEEPGVIFLADGDGRELIMTYEELDRSAEALAQGLRERGLAGRCIALSFPSGLDFVIAFLGCVYCGAIAVPTHPIRAGDALGEARLARLAQDCDAAIVLSTADAVRARLVDGRQPSAGVSWLSVEAVSVSTPARRHIPRPEDIALLQYTSGSTSSPKGVMVSHANLAANFAAISHAMRLNSDTVFMSWLPLFHDMGLIGILLQALYRGQKLALMSPQHFVQRPIRWLRAITQYRATLSGGPNFAYEACLRRSTAQQRAGLDLSSWQVAFNGAEPVRASTLRDFAHAFQPHGFQPQSLFPCYGLAETTLFAAGGWYDPARSVVAFDHDQLSSGVGALQAGNSPSVEVVGCGAPPPEHGIAIVDPLSRQSRGEGEIGEIWLHGPSIAQGYWGRPDGSFDAVTADGAAGYLRTGDLGMFFGGQLFVTGRIKDMLIIRGRNVYPSDIEWASEHSCPEAELGAAVAVLGEELVGQESGLVVVQEVRRPRGVPLQTLLQQIVAAVTQAVELSPKRIVLVPSGSIPRTSSGKVRRFMVRDALTSGSFEVLEELRFDHAREAPE